MNTNGDFQNLLKSKKFGASFKQKCSDVSSKNRNMWSTACRKLLWSCSGAKVQRKRLPVCRFLQVWTSAGLLRPNTDPNPAALQNLSPQQRLVRTPAPSTHSCVKMEIKRTQLGVWMNNTHKKNFVTLWIGINWSFWYFLYIKTKKITFFKYRKMSFFLFDELYIMDYYERLSVIFEKS